MSYLIYLFLMKLKEKRMRYVLGVRFLCQKYNGKKIYNSFSFGHW